MLLTYLLSRSLGGRRGTDEAVQTSCRHIPLSLAALTYLLLLTLPYIWSFCFCLTYSSVFDHFFLRSILNSATAFEFSHLETLLPAGPQRETASTRAQAALPLTRNWGPVPQRLEWRDRVGFKQHKNHSHVVVFVCKNNGLILYSRYACHRCLFKRQLCKVNPNIAMVWHSGKVHYPFIC